MLPNTYFTTSRSKSYIKKTLSTFDSANKVLRKRNRTLSLFLPLFIVILWTSSGDVIIQLKPFFTSLL